VAGKPVLEFIRDSIVNPNAYLEPGMRSGILASQTDRSGAAAAETGEIVWS